MSETTHFGEKTVPLSDKQGLVDKVFHDVADRYDLMNDLMSGGVHRLWKDAMVSRLAPPKRGNRPYRVLDMAGGTGDIAERIVNASVGYAEVTVADINNDMLRVGRERAKAWRDRDPAEAPRLGFFGVIDERMDLALIEALADARPDWAIEMVGPVVKIDSAQLPRRPNLSYPGGCRYEALPGWLGGWDVALMPFAINESTRFISPTVAMRKSRRGSGFSPDTAPRKAKAKSSICARPSRTSTAPTRIACGGGCESLIERLP